MEGVGYKEVKGFESGEKIVRESVNQAGDGELACCGAAACFGEPERLGWLFKNGILFRSSLGKGRHR